MKVTGMSIDVVERQVPNVRIRDHRGGIGGTVRNGVLRIETDQGIEVTVPSATVQAMRMR